MRFRKKVLIGLGVLTTGSIAYNSIITPSYLVNNEMYDKYPELRSVDLDHKRMSKIGEYDENDFPERARTALYEIDELNHNAVMVDVVPERVNDPENVHVYVGGLQALFAAARKLEEWEQEEKLSKAEDDHLALLKKAKLPVPEKRRYPKRDKIDKRKAIYVNDGEPLIAFRAGLQLHEHPTQFPDYNYFRLIRKTLKTLNVLPEMSPFDVDYSPLHMNFYKPFFSHPIQTMKEYLGFFVNKIEHSFHKKRGVSDDDYRLVLLIRNSINYMEELDKKCRETTGESFMNRNGRFYWSDRESFILGKQDMWSAMGIETEIVNYKRLQAGTLLDAKRHNLIGLYMKNDGEIHPTIISVITKYLTARFPDRFEFKNNTAVSAVGIDKESRKPCMVEFNGEEQIPATHVMGSLGHDKVYLDKVDDDDKAYDLLPVTGVSTDWRAKISREELEERCKPELIERGMSLESYLAAGLFLPTADMRNLHVKFVDYEIKEDNIFFYMRVTGGANLHHYYADRRDLLNIAWKLNEYFVGEWTPIAVGSCSRQTTAINRPEIAGPFHYGQSGVGISMSAGDHSTECFKDPSTHSQL